MATLSIYGRPSSGGLIAARSGDTLVGSSISSHTGSSLILNADSTSILFKIGGSTYLTVTSSSIGATAGTAFTGDGSGLTGLPIGSLTGGPIGVSLGGSGAATLTDRGVLMGRGTAAFQASSAGTAGQVFTSKGASINGDYADTVTATNGSASLSSSPFTLNAANGVYQDIGLSISLPSAGTYLVTASIRNDINTSSGIGSLLFKLQNSTDAVDIANSERMGANAGTINTYALDTTVISEIITVAASKTIKVLGARVNATTYAVSQVVNASDGRSRISYVKIAP